MSPLLIKQLIERITDHVDKSYNHQGFGVASRYIEDHIQPKDVGNGKTQKEEVSQKYLYETYNAVEKAIQEKKEDLRTSRAKMDAIAEALGYKNFSEFEKTILSPLDPLLDHYEGNWWSIVRANGSNHILKAPIKIYKDKVENKMKIDMKGGARSFTGYVQLRAGNLFCELDSNDNKILYLIMKIGSNKYTRLLQGIFAGISSAEDPIAGRELFWKEEQLSFDDMQWEKLPVNTPKLDKRITNYFAKSEGNCLKGGQASVHDMVDLELNIRDENK
jgi:hypothetical protein